MRIATSLCVWSCCTIPSIVTQHRAHAMSIQSHTFRAETVATPTAKEERGSATTIRVAPRVTTTVLLLNLSGNVDQGRALRDF